MKTININVGTVTLTGDVLAIYSRQPVEVSLSTAAVSNGKSRVTVSCARTGRSLSEDRLGRQSGAAYVAEYEISRMLQIVGDVESVLSRVKYDGTPCATSDVFEIKIEAYKLGTLSVVGTFEVSGLYGCSDWNETIDAAKGVRRLFVDYPQTISVGAIDEEAMWEPDGTYITAVKASDKDLALESSRAVLLELDLLQALQAAGSADYQQHLDGAAPGAAVTFAVSAAEGQGTRVTGTRDYSFFDAKEGAGKYVYLRWLQTDGSVGYWLLKQSKQATEVAAATAYTTPLAGVPAAPVDGVIRNPARQDYAVQESITVGADRLLEEEFAYLLGLASSPCVEMLNGGTRTEPQWVRVTVSPASYSREIAKTGLPKIRTFEASIILPKRNTIKL